MFKHIHHNVMGNPRSKEICVLTNDWENIIAYWEEYEHLVRSKYSWWV